MSDGAAVEVIEATTEEPVLVLTCEHASNALPTPWTWPSEDRRLVDTHWAYDIGIAEVTRQLARQLGAPAVLSTFSRLLIDPNRDLDSDTLFRREADGRAVGLNRAMSDEDRAQRIESYWRPYHAAVDATVAKHPGAFVLGMHSFTSNYQGELRAVQLGVLYDDDLAFGEWWYEALRKQVAYDTRVNEPWSGRGGFMFGPQHHATRYGRFAVELEIRNDLTVDAAAMADLVKVLASVSRAAASHWGKRGW